ncbi:MAG: PAS domain S-box protein [Gallionella sp.]|nr:PAS domain S-box protein [Gallionella sp.]MDD4946427.1 PAS domain S-box protein [Gallionella sp.]
MEHLSSPELACELTRMFLERAADPIFILDIEGHFIAVNQAACQHTGYSREELLRMTPQDIDDPASRDKIQERLAQLRRDRQATFEAVHIHRSGRHIPVEMHIQLIEHAGKLFTMNICRDISERQQRELEYHTLVQTTLEGFWLVSAQDGSFLDVNDAYCNMVGHSRQALLSMHISDVEANESAEEVAKHINQVMTKGHDHFETRHRHKDGHLIDIELSVSYSPIRGGVFFTFLRDISRRKRQENDLKMAAAVFDSSSAAIMISDENNRILRVNPAFTAITGYQPDEVIGHNPKILSSGMQTGECYREMWDTLKKNGNWQGELWNRHKDGQVFAEHLSINIIANNDGSTYRHIAVFSDITEKKQAEDKVWHQANYDTITNLPNRRLFLDRLKQEIGKCKRSKLPMALFFIDLDRFKEINDTYGHDAGDQLLSEAARRLQACVRTTDTVARLAGDEFTVILPEISGPDKIESIAQHMLDRLAEPFLIQNSSLQISGSIGIAIYPAQATDLNDLISKADIAMYAAKREGRNCYRCYACNI